MFSEVKQPDPKPSLIQGVRQQDHFTCIDPDCIKAFRKEKQYIHHISIGEHVYDEQKLDTLEDRSKRLWSIQCNELRFEQQNISFEAISEEPMIFENHGYALKRRKKTSRFPVKVKNYLTDLYRNGEETGRKISPQVAAKKMRSEADEEGIRLFSPVEWLSPQQIRSFFANLCLKKQRVSNVIKVEGAEIDEELENAIVDLVAIERSQELSRIVDLSLNY